MTRILKLAAVIYLTVLVQTNLADLLRVSGVAPDFMIAALAALAPFYGWMGGVSAGALMSMLYDAAVGYALALDLILYSVLGYFSPLMLAGFRSRVRTFSHFHSLPAMAMAFFMTAIREIADIGYLFLIGAEQGLVTLLRALIACTLTALVTLPVNLIITRLFAQARKTAE